MHLPPFPARLRTRSTAVAALATLFAAAALAAVAPAPAGADAAFPACSQPGVDDKCEAWVATHLSESSPTDGGRPYDVAASPDGSAFFVTGEFDTVGFTANGDELWAAAFPQGPNDFNPPTGYSVAVSPDSTRVYVTGQYQFPGDPYSATVAYDALTGAQLWLALDGLPGHTGAGTYVEASPDGTTVFVAGENSGRCFEPTDPCGGITSLTAYDAATGARRWVAQSAANEVPSGMALNPAGTRVYVVGNLGEVVSYEAATGAELWTGALPGDGPGDALRAVSVSPDGASIFVTGQTCQDNGDVPCNRYVTAALNSGDGSVAWVARRAGTLPLVVSWGLAASSSADRVFVSGRIEEPGQQGNDIDGVVLAYDAATGALAWEQRYDAEAFSEFTSVAVSPDSTQVVATGRAYQDSLNGARDFATVAYRTSDGHRDWVARYNAAPTADGLSVETGGIAVSPLGRVLIPGTFSGTHSHLVPSGPSVTSEWGILAYDLGTPPPSLWRMEGSIVLARSASTATRLNDGRVLLAGGCLMQNAEDPCLVHTGVAELYSPASSAWTLTAPISTPRAGHTATLLDDGRVFIAGGCVTPTDLVACPGSPLTEVYVPSLGVFVPSGPLAGGRVAHAVTRLTDGRVLLTGGRDALNTLATAEVYDPATGLSAAVGPMGAARSDHTSTLLPNGKVLVAGGRGPGGAPLASAELYDPATNVFSPTSSMASVRFGHTATSVSGGTVLVAGGGTDGLGAATASVEAYDATTGTFIAAGRMARTRFTHTATLLAGGSMLITGGRGNSGAVRSAELYDPASGTSVYTDPMHVARAGTVFNPVGHVTAALADGRVLVAGGSMAAVTETYRPPADLSVAMTASPSPGQVGRPLTYTAVTTNGGPAGASGVKVTVALPPGAVLVSATSSGGTCSVADRVVTCSAGILSNTTAATVTVVVRPTRLGSAVSVATVTANEHDPNPTNNSATATSTVGP